MDTIVTIITIDDPKAVAPAGQKPHHSSLLTPQQRDILRGLAEAIKAHGNPNLREIAVCAGEHYYPSGVHRYLRQLEAKGRVALGTPGRHRSMRLLEPLKEDE